jgi:MEMO1 family protein
LSRQSFVAGSFYPADAETLLDTLEALSPDIPKDKKETAIGAIVPHAGYLYSGRVAGEVYGRMKGRETFVLVGPNHTGTGHSFSLSSENWVTPLGEIETDKELAAALKEASSIIKDDPSAHKKEHSIEVQLPFIKKFFPASRILPLCVSSSDVSKLKEVGEAIAFSAKSLGRDISVLASSDMTHYEPRETASVKDKEAIEAVLSLDAFGLAETVMAKNITMCGWAPSVIMILAALEFGAVRSRLIKYSDSGEVTGNTMEVVGYAGVIVS